MYTPKYPAVAHSGLVHRAQYIVYIYSEYPAVRPAWMAVGGEWFIGKNLREEWEKFGKVFDYSLSTPP